MRIDKNLYQHDLTSDTFYIAEMEHQPDFTIIEKPRIGVHYAKDWAERLLRFYIEGNPYISRS
jgi:DNA-3-methyladenine glycosylase